MHPSEARSWCLSQHEWLRRLLTRTAALARRFRDGEPLELALATNLRRLREAYTAHNAFELSVLQPLLHDVDAWGAARVDRMMEEHGAEHRALEDLLSGTTAEVAMRFDDFAELVDAHMAAEERTFLSVQVLSDRDDAEASL